MSRTNIRDRAAGQVLISDGGWGTLLQERGLRTGECPELWCLRHPERVEAVAASYVEAGAELIQTNSFGGNRYKLELYGLAGQTAEINRRAAELSRQAAGRQVLVLGSVGPTGKMLLMGEVDEDDLYAAFKEQAQALADGQADAICVETMSALDEAALAIRAARENTDLEVVATFTFEKSAHSGEYRTMMGVTPAEAARGALTAGADIVGSNCGNGFAGMVEIVRQMRGAIDPAVPILVHANAGLPRLVDGREVFPESPQSMAGRLPALIAAGANIVGGCCGTTPAHVAALKAARDADRR